MKNTTEYKKLLFGTGILPIISVAMYGTSLDPEQVLSNDLYLLEDEDRYKFWNLFDNSKYNDFILECASSVMKNSVVPDLLGLKIGIILVDNYHMWSPKTYNHNNDKLHFDINVKDNMNVLLINKLKEQNQEELSKFLKQNYSSYDGFMSFTSNNIEDLLERILEWNDQDIAAGITFLLKDHIKDYQYVLEEKINENSSPISFIKDKRKAKKIIEKILNG